MNCPICDKAGLPENALICSQCNSDLSGFNLIQKVATQKQLSEKKHLVLEQELKQNKTQKQLSEEKRLVLEQKLQKSKAQKRNILLLSSVVVLFLFAAFWFWNTKKDTSLLPIANGIQISKDSLVKVIAEKDVLITQTKNENERLRSGKNEIKYAVKKGDYLIKISRFFYGDAEHYLKIMEENNLQKNTPLLVGDTLTLNLQN
jgi:nucleoid-associated protein YgaU